MAKTRWLDAREAAAWQGLQLMQLRLDAELARQLAADSSLSLPDYLVLVALTGHPDGRLRAFELAHTLGWDKTRLSHHVKRMLDRDLIEKQPCPQDRRGYFVAVTDHGRNEITAAAPGHLVAVRSLFLDHVSVDELDVLSQVAARVLERMAAQVSSD